MTGDELIEVFRPMTERPWHAESPADSGSAICSDGFVLAVTSRGGDATAIVALANHAEPLAALVVACERWRAWPGIPDEVLWALDRVHAVRREGR